METNNRDKSPELEDQKISDGEVGDGPFSQKQMRALKMMTGIMGVMIVICVILLGIGLSRQSAKLATDGPAPQIALDKSAEILGITADGSDGIWLHSKTGDEETIQYYKSSGKKGPHFIIAR